MNDDLTRADLLEQVNEKYFEFFYAKAVLYPYGTVVAKVIDKYPNSLAEVVQMHEKLWSDLCIPGVYAHDGYVRVLRHPAGWLVEVTVDVPLPTGGIVLESMSERLEARREVYMFGMENMAQAMRSYGQALEQAAVSMTFLAGLLDDVVSDIEALKSKNDT